jgi:HSP90 family molecular chaperone
VYIDALATKTHVECSEILRDSERTVVLLVVIPVCFHQKQKRHIDKISVFVNRVFIDDEQRLAFLKLKKK